MCLKNDRADLIILDMSVLLSFIISIISIYLFLSKDNIMVVIIYSDNTRDTVLSPVTTVLLTTDVSVANC